jgi:hypothetical protein
VEPREPNDKQTSQPRPEEKPKRFLILKLEERIAPSHGHGHSPTLPPSYRYCTGGCKLSIE